MTTQTKMYVIWYSQNLRTRGLYSKALDGFDTVEFKFSVSPNDFVQNIIEVKRARRAIKLAQAGFPNYRDMQRDLVSDLSPVPSFRLRLSCYQHDPSFS